MERGAVYCAPLRFASGIQNKLLEALAMEVPVVTTPVVADGLRAGGVNPPMIIADADEAIAEGVVRLLRTTGRPPAPRPPRAAPSSRTRSRGRRTVATVEQRARARGGPAASSGAHRAPPPATVAGTVTS